MTTLLITWTSCLLLHTLEYVMPLQGWRIWPLERATTATPWLLAAAGGMACALDGFLVGGMVEHLLAAGGTPPRRWLRFILWLFVRVPLLCFYALPLGAWLQQERPAWAFSAQSQGTAGAASGRQHADDPGSPLHGGFSRTWYSRYSHALGMALVAANTLGVLAGCAWLLDPDRQIPEKWALLLGLRIGLRLLAFGSTLGTIRMLYRSGEISALEFGAASLLSSTWLTPWPGFVLGFIVAAFVDRRRQRPLLVGLAFAGRNALRSRLEEAQPGMDWWRASQWQRFRQGWPDQMPFHRRPDARLTALYRVKAFLLLIDSGALVMALSRCEARWRLLERLLYGLRNGAERLFWSFSGWHLLAIVSLAILVSRCPELLRLEISPERLLFWRYLTLTPLAVLTGALQWSLVAAAAPIAVAVSLACVGWSAALSIYAIAMPLRLRTRPETRLLADVAPWLALFMAMDFVAESALADDSTARRVLAGMRLVAKLSPVCALGVGLLGGRSLILPWRLSQLFSRRLAPRSRLALGLLALSSVLPFGGLAVPFWGGLRRRLAQQPAGTGAR
jgi:hypothetical protein